MKITASRKTELYCPWCKHFRAQPSQEYDPYEVQAGVCMDGNLPGLVRYDDYCGKFEKSVFPLETQEDE